MYTSLIQLKEATCSEEETKVAELRKKLSDMEMACQVHVVCLYALVEAGILWSLCLIGYHTYESGHYGISTMH